MTKMTYTMALDNAIALFTQGGQIDPEDVETVEKLEALKNQLAKKNASASKSVTKRQKLNEEVKAHIMEVLDEDGMTVTEILKALNDEDLTNQRVSALLRTMDGVDKRKEKGKSLYFLA